MTWVRACATEEIEPGEAVSVPVEPPVAVFNVDDEWLATADLCSHGQSSLSEDGYLDGAVVECGWHFAKFCLRTGAVIAAPAQSPIKTYETKVENGEVFVLILDEDG